MVKKKEEELAPGEAKYVAMVKLMLNYGKLTVLPGTVIILGPDDWAAGINVNKLVENRAVVPYESEEQVKAIKEHWEKEGKPRRDELKSLARQRKGRR